MSSKKSRKNDKPMMPLPGLHAETRMTALRKTAQIITGQWGIDVIFRGGRAYTDGKTIVVPSLPEDADDGLVDAIIGFLDHESGHILDTDMTEKRPFTDPDKRVRSMTNAIEDIRMEYKHGQRYRGVGMNLERSSEWAMRKLRDSWGDEMPKLFRLSVLMMSHAKRVQDSPFTGAFYDECVGDYAPIIDALKPRIEKWIELKSTEESYLEAKEILRLLDEMKSDQTPPPGSGGDDDQEEPQKPEPQKSKGQKPKPEKKPEPEEPEPGDDEGEEDGSGDGDESEGPDGEPDSGSDDSEDADEEEKEGGKPGNGDGSDGDGEDADEEEGEEGSGDADGEGGNKETDGADGDGDQDEDGAEPGGDADDGDAPEVDSDLNSSDTPSLEEGEGPSGHRGILDAICGDYDPEEVTDKGLHEYTADQISTDCGSADGHRPYTEEFDRVMEPDGTMSLERYSAMREEVLPYVGVVSGVLTRVLMAQTRSRTMYGRYSGTVSMNSISQLRAGQTTIFKQKRDGLKLDTYVELVVDHSGSMDGKKIETATKTCIVLAEALEKVGVKFGICGFTTGYTTRNLDKAQAKRLVDFRNNIWNDPAVDDFHRIEPIIEFRYKTPEEPFALMKSKLALMPDQYMGANADGDSIYKIAKRVALRREKRKVIIVLSDGFPASAQGRNIEGDAAERYMKRVSAMLDRTPDLEIIGIGINSTAVKAFYKRTAIVNTIADLPAIAMGELKQALMGK